MKYTRMAAVSIGLYFVLTAIIGLLGGFGPFIQPPELMWLYSIGFIWAIATDFYNKPS